MSQRSTNPIAVLRSLFERNQETKWHATQAGFAQFLGRSESLIRAVESGRVKMSPKLARLISGKTGVDMDWLMRAEVSGIEIPGANGGALVAMIPGFGANTKHVPATAFPTEPSPSSPSPSLPRSAYKKANARYYKTPSHRRHLMAIITNMIRMEIRGLKNEGVLEFIIELQQWLASRREEQEGENQLESPIDDSNKSSTNEGNKQDLHGL